jgi:transcription initiation factor IIE alpha subunit
MKPMLIPFPVGDYDTEIECECGYFLGFAKHEECSLSFSQGDVMFQCPSCKTQFDFIYTGEKKDYAKDRIDEIKKQINQEFGIPKELLK